MPGTLQHPVLTSCLVLFLGGLLRAQTCEKYEDRCSQCLSASAECVWCADEVLNVSTSTVRSRCNFIHEFELSSWCKHPILPEKSKNLTKDDNFTTFIQIRPQEVTLRLRIGQNDTFNVSVLRAPDYPIDLYYLMDVSASMKDDLQQLKTLANELTATVRGLTKNFRLGFGKFVDKEVLPFVDTEKLYNPCGFPCDPPFAFINALPLNSDEKVFETGIQGERTSGNLDTPEDLLDALMQTVVCREAINWTENAWHLVVAVTDATFHTAGDGKLAGIYTPNDGLCHLDSGGRYNRSTEQDYPSVSHIRKVLFDNQVYPIFAVTDNHKPLYTALQETLSILQDTRGFVGTLASDSKNVLTLIEEGYDAIASQVSLKADIKDDRLISAEIKAVSCPGNNASNSSGQSCTGVSVGERAVFQVFVELHQCTSEPLILYLNAGAYGQTTVTVEPICTCSCEELGVQNSSKCSGHGTLECGVCDCEPLWSGKECQCYSGANTTSSACKPAGDERACSGNGTCLCDKCKCSEDAEGRPLYSGTYCQCRQSSCNRDGMGRECGGQDHGVCECDGPNCTCECRCLNGWRKDESNPGACECQPIRLSSCIDPAGQICSNNGKCGCDGNCDCNQGYFGKHCLSCTGCPDICVDKNVRRCVVCEKFDISCNDTDCPFNITLLAVKKDIGYQIPHQGKPQPTKQCTMKDGDDCIYVFYMTEQELDGVRHVHAEKDDLKDCPESIDVVPIIIGIIVGIFVIGLAIVIVWTLLARFAAYREYKAFEKDRGTANWSQTTSPLYQPPTQKYMNPRYRKKAEKS